MTRLLLAAAASLALSATQAAAVTFGYTGAIVTWEVPESATYAITAGGGQGGSFLVGAGPAAPVGGAGIPIGGYFELSAGTVLQLAVGGMGASGSFAGGGGGGSFVVAPGNTPLLVAGGGGGVRFNTISSGTPANPGRAGYIGSGLGLIGFQVELPAQFDGKGAPGTEDLIVGAGGGGFTTGGAGNPGYATGGASWLDGLAGGTDLAGCGVEEGSGTVLAHGGFGGGGAGSGAGCTGAGGGGGWSGGRGGVVAGGGGSYNADTLTGFVVLTFTEGNGFITIEAVPTPEPASATLALMGLLGLAAIRRRG